MDIPSEKYKSEESQPAPISTVLQTVTGFVSSVIGFFSLTEEERLQAGINERDEGRKE